MWVSSRRLHSTTSLYVVLSVIYLPGTLPWNLKWYTVYWCRSHFREAWSMDCDVTIRDVPTWTDAWMECTSESFLGRCKFNIFGDRDMIADAKRRTQTGCGPKIPESAHLSHIHRAKMVQRGQIFWLHHRSEHSGGGHYCEIWCEIHRAVTHWAHFTCII